MTDTRELERTRNGAKVMERTLEAAAARIKELEDGIAQISKYLAPASPSVALARSCAAALLEKS